MTMLDNLKCKLGYHKPEQEHISIKHKYRTTNKGRSKKRYYTGIKELYTITHHVQAINPRALDICEEHTELVGFDDVKAEVCARYRAEVEQGIKTEEEHIIALQKQQLAGKDQLLADAQMKLDRLMKRGWWDRLWNNINL